MLASQKAFDIFFWRIDKKTLLNHQNHGFMKNALKVSESHLCDL